jgi:hypothetical protein
VRGFADAPSPKRQRAKRAYIFFGGRECQPSNAKERGGDAAIALLVPAIPPSPGEVRFRSACAALRPHSSAVLYTIVSGMSQCGGAAASAKGFSLGDPVALMWPGSAWRCLSP